jgi:large subunit ribosomal protein L13
MKTKTPSATEIKRTWWHVDAEDQILGRLATTIAQKLIGKDKPYFVANIDCGDYVVVSNVEKIDVTGKKRKQKMYYRHSGFPSGLKEANLETVLEKKPEEVLKSAVSGMLPKNKLRAPRLNRLKLVVGSEHNYADKSLQELSVKS